MRYRYSDLACEFETKSEGDTASFTGIASTADADLHNDVIQAGAFEPIARKSNGEPDVLLLRDHDRSHVIGGWKDFRQDGKRLRVEGELCLAVEKARETHALMKAGHISGLSVGFRADKDGVTFNTVTGRRYIKKATLFECSVVAMPANRGARVIEVKADAEEIEAWLSERGFQPQDIEILHERGFDGLLAERLKESDPKKPFGDVDYADPGYQDDGVYRYPIDTERRIRAAWSYINMERNQAPYTRDQLARIRSRIIAAWKDKIDEAGPPAIHKTLFTGIDDHFPLSEEKAAEALRGLLTQLRGVSP